MVGAAFGIDAKRLDAVDYCHGETGLRIDDVVVGSGGSW